MKLRQALIASYYQSNCAIMMVMLIITIIILFHPDATKAQLTGTSPSAPKQPISDHNLLFESPGSQTSRTEALPAGPVGVCAQGGLCPSPPTQP